ncbi:MAG: TetR/AcrR family transcriptional regulator [Archaeoglobus sp.]|nr:TetR/AcrR family transcriptional regulator [Archaeoglobus sp.]
MKEKILKAALKLYSSKPPQNVTTKEIARAAGVSVGLIFHYFHSKNELERELVSHFMEKHSLQTERLDEFVRENLRFAKENPGIFRFLQYVFEKEKYADSDLAIKVYEDGLKKLKTMLGGDERKATLLMAMIDGLAMYAFLLDLDVEEFSDSILETLGFGGENR